METYSVEVDPVVASSPVSDGSLVSWTPKDGAKKTPALPVPVAVWWGLGFVVLLSLGAVLSWWFVLRPASSSADLKRVTPVIVELPVVVTKEPDVVMRGSSHLTVREHVWTLNTMEFILDYRQQRIARVGDSDVMGVVAWGEAQVHVYGLTRSSSTSTRQLVRDVKHLRQCGDRIYMQQSDVGNGYPWLGVVWDGTQVVVSNKRVWSGTDLYPRTVLSVYAPLLVVVSTLDHAALLWEPLRIENDVGSLSVYQWTRMAEVGGVVAAAPVWEVSSIPLYRPGVDPFAAVQLVESTHQVPHPRVCILLDRKIVVRAWRQRHTPGASNSPYLFQRQSSPWSNIQDHYESCALLADGSVLFALTANTLEMWIWKERTDQSGQYHLQQTVSWHGTGYRARQVGVDRSAYSVSQHHMVVLFDNVEPAWCNIVWERSMDSTQQEVFRFLYATLRIGMGSSSVGSSSVGAGVYRGVAVHEGLTHTEAYFWRQSGIELLTVELVHLDTLD
jgi:hypothetical protein